MGIISFALVNIHGMVRFHLRNVSVTAGDEYHKKAWPFCQCLRYKEACCHARRNRAETIRYRACISSPVAQIELDNYIQRRQLFIVNCPQP